MMRQLSVRIDKRLREVESWWKLQCFLKWTILLALSVTLFVLAMGMAIVVGWITQPAWANGWLALLVIVSIVSWLIIALISAGTPKESDWLAASLEKSRSDLEDSLNTVVYLQDQRDTQSRELSRALEHQVEQVLAATPSACPFPWKRILRHTLTLAIALLVTITFYNRFQPWDRLLAAAVPAPPSEQADPADLEIPESPKSSEQQETEEQEKVAWGEIRITEPGRDLKVTRLDLISMQIEAASNRTLKRVDWVTLISEGPTERHGLPAPDHPNYVVYRPSLIVEDYGLEEWDVMSYYAEASTREGEVYRSVEYFIEVVPPRPELEKLPDPAYQSLEEITGLIEWQQEVIRETGRLTQLKELDAEDVNRRHEELAAQEQNLQQAVEHLSARLESRFGTEPLEGLRERFESAAYSLQDAQKQLEELQTADSAPSERSALGRLAAARKHFHERVKQNPAAFEASVEDLLVENSRKDSSQLLDERQLQNLNERLDERQQSLTQSQDKLERLIKRQQLVELKTKRARDKLWKELSESEQQLENDLQELAQQSTDSSEDFQSDAQTAGETLQRSQEALEREDKPSAERETAKATEQLEQLAQTLENEMEQLELTQQMLLEERLRRNREEYRQIEEQTQPRTPEELEQTTKETQEIVEELEKITQQPSESAEIPPSKLQAELTPEKREQLAGQCDKMCQQPGTAGQSDSAGQIGQSLDKLSQALGNELAQKLASQDSPQQQEQLDQMQATQDQRAQAREAVQQALAEQREIERGINPSKPQQQPQLSQRQKQATDALEEATKQNPQGFSQSESETAGAKNSMRQSERSLQQSNPLSRQRANEAAEELRKLDSSLEEQQQKSQLADAYRQKQMLDEQIEQLKRFEQNPESVSPSQCQSSGGACKNLTSSLQNLMQQPGMEGSFGPKVQEALNGENKQQIDQQSDALADSQNPGDIKSSARQLRESLEQLSQAFESGQPNRGLARQPGSSLKPSGQQAISQGLRRLESESQRNRQGRPVPRQESQQLREDAMSHLAEGLYGEYGYNDQTRAVIMRWKEELTDPEFTVDQRVVQQLLRDIQQTRGEVELSESDPRQKPGVQTIDPSKYPPEYRPLIESYFQKLSERP